MKKKDYYLPACLVLFAAVVGNRRACHWAIENLPSARRWAGDNQPHIRAAVPKELRGRKQGGRHV
jgi:hypothetical protein